MEVKESFSDKYPLKIFICEDEEAQLKELVAVIEQMESEEQLIVEGFLSPESLLEELQEKKPDLVLIDIVMPEMDGITLAKKIRGILPDCYLIFTTAYAEYAIQGYEANAFRYLLKPITAEKVKKVLHEIRNEMKKSRKLLIKAVDGEHILKLDEILYLSAEDKYTILYTKERHFIDRTSLNDYERMLNPYGFSRVHRKFIINRIHHKCMGKGVITLDNGATVSISRRKEQEYRKNLFSDIEEEVLK